MALIPYIVFFRTSRDNTADTLSGINLQAFATSCVKSEDCSDFRFCTEVRNPSHASIASRSWPAVADVCTAKEATMHSVPQSLWRFESRDIAAARSLLRSRRKRIAVFEEQIVKHRIIDLSRLVS